MSKDHVIIICRTNSKRFKNKAIKKFNKSTLIEHLINNIKNTNYFKSKNICIATTKLKSDDILEKIAKKNNINILRGSKKNIIERIFNTFKRFNISRAIITSGDNPFFLKDVVKKILSKKDKVVFTENLPVGLNLTMVNAFAINKINKACLTTNNENGFYLYLQSKIEETKVINYNNSKAKDNSRFTIDYPEDFLFFKKITPLIGKNMSYPKIKKILKKNPKLKKINLHNNDKYKLNLKKKVYLKILDRNKIANIYFN